MKSEKRRPRAGIYFPGINGRGGAERVSLQLAVELVAIGWEPIIYTDHVPHRSELEAEFGARLHGIRFERLRVSRSTSRLHGEPKKLAELARHARQLRAANLDLFVNALFKSQLPGCGRTNIYYVHFPHRTKVPHRNWLHRLYMSTMDLAERYLIDYRHGGFLSTYQQIWANSEFTASHVRSRWGVNAEVVYPPCSPVEPQHKERVIAVVGRFQRPDGNAPYKAQDILIDFFEELPDLHRSGWRLVLAGGLTSRDIGYLADLRMRASKLPVSFLVNAERTEIEELLGKASLYWHGQGAGFSADLYPETQEHFGISVVEALSAGAIPIVYGAAGPAEIVGNVVEEGTWDDRDSLLQRTRRYAAASDAELHELRLRCQKRAGDFSIASFRGRLRGLLSVRHDLPSQDFPDGWPRHLRRVVFVAPRYPEMSGGATYVRNFAAELEKVGVEVMIFSVYPGDEVGEGHSVHTIIRRERLHRNPTFRSEGSYTRRLRKIPALLFKSVDRLRYRLLLKRRLDSLGSDSMVVFTHVLAKKIVDESGFQRRREGPLLIGQHHSSFDSIHHEPWLSAAIPKYFAEVDGFTVLSTGDAKSFSEVLSAPCYRIPNFANVEIGSRSHAEAEPSRNVVVAFARFSPEKRLDLMIRAFVIATDRADLRQWRLDLYGEGEQRGLLEATVANLGASDRVAVHPRTSDVEGILRSAKLNLLTSKYEGFGMSVLEAAQCGVPSLAFDCSDGLSELMRSVSGILVPNPDDFDAYVVTLRSVLLDQEALRKRRLAAYEGSLLYAPDQVMARWSEVLEEIEDRREEANLSETSRSAENCSDG